MKENNDLFELKNTTEAFDSTGEEFSEAVLGVAEKPVDEITIEAETSEIEKALDFISEKTGNLPFPLKEKNRIEIAVDEIVSNIVNYAYDDGKGSVSIKTESDSDGITITVTDSGIPYNPLEKEDPDITLSADERRIGGYGIFIVKNIMDNVGYDYKDGKNIFTMRKNIQNKEKINE